MLVSDGAELAPVDALRTALFAELVATHVVAPHKGEVRGSGDGPPSLVVDRSFLTACSAECDAVVVAAGTSLVSDAAVIAYVQEAYRHHKPIAALGDGADLLAAAGIAPDAPGVLVSDDVDDAFVATLVEALGRHRVWDRPAPVSAATGEVAR